MQSSKERSVPSSRVMRLANYGYLAVGLGAGAAAEVLIYSSDLIIKESGKMLKMLKGAYLFMTQISYLFYKKMSKEKKFKSYALLANYGYLAVGFYLFYKRTSKEKNILNF